MGRLSVAKKLFLIAGKEARSLAAVQEAERRVYGLDYKRLQEAQRRDDADARERQELIKSLLTSLESLKQRRMVPMPATELRRRACPSHCGG
jgi:hypothetical protein